MLWPSLNGNSWLREIDYIIVSKFPADLIKRSPHFSHVTIAIPNCTLKCRYSRLILRVYLLAVCAKNWAKWSNLKQLLNFEITRDTRVLNGNLINRTILRGCWETVKTVLSKSLPKSQLFARKETFVQYRPERFWNNISVRKWKKVSVKAIF